jgi:hypothetical protein
MNGMPMESEQPEVPQCDSCLKRVKALTRCIWYPSMMVGPCCEIREDYPDLPELQPIRIQPVSLTLPEFTKPEVACLVVRNFQRGQFASSIPSQPSATCTARLSIRSANLVFPVV